ncbi:MAG: lipoate--protein ligase family protein [Verrucomicrobiota bacterium]|jgi:lipoate-protein ligase A
MKYFDCTLSSPAANLAADEALLDWTEGGDGGEVLRFWESPEYFVVVGYANKIAAEVNGAACKAQGIPILRRCSGGGTVVQGPGCLNYALVLRISQDGPLRNISTANRFIMERNRAAIASLRPVRGTAGGDATTPGVIRVRGHTDLCLGNLKFSGNSQRRRKRSLLFHGTFLLKFDLSLIAELLLPPSRQPAYRQSRPHAGFLTNLGAPAEAVKSALQKFWGAQEALMNPPVSAISALEQYRYTIAGWNYKF